MRGSPSGSIWSPKRSPKRPPRAPKRSPRELQNALKTIIVSKTSVFQKSMNVSAKINVFEVRKVILGAQNRPQEAPREDKKRLRRSLNNKRREEGQQGRQKETIRAPKLLCHHLIWQRRVSDEKERGGVWSVEAPRQPHARG